MAGHELQGCLSLQGIPNFYKVMFFISLVLLILMPSAILNSSFWLESREILLDGRLAGLEAEIESLEQQIAGDKDHLAGLDAEVLDIARAEQVFSSGSEQGNLWGPDTRWSEMGRARVEEIWRRHGAAQKGLAEAQESVRQKRAELVLVQAGKSHMAHLRAVVSNHRVALYGVILVGAFATVLFALLWGALIQTRVNAILSSWARKQ
ncbi:hypothetical protein [Anaerobaca lacustris]|uniref:Uncharacterized protein n=1 Tax=Anaerobaca lacustris TaxID=3044600 RepID=A0AAW6U108_9BACT|nr:hypothetical protein [Sedimentisphaerales bacterium M17dextr]